MRGAAHKIQAILFESGLGLKDFAAVCGVKLATAKKIEQGLGVSDENMHKVLLAFNLPASYLFSGNRKWTKQRGVFRDKENPAIVMIDNQPKGGAHDKAGANKKGAGKGGRGR